MIENALILAAGKGTRMWPLTENIPKPLLPICGLPIIERQIQELKKVGVKKLYILIGYQMKELSDYLGKTKLGIQIQYIVQEEQKGTGHAVNQAKNIIKGNFYCINGDLIVLEGKSDIVYLANLPSLVGEVPLQDSSSPSVKQFLQDQTGHLELTGQTLFGWVIRMDSQGHMVIKGFPQSFVLKPYRELIEPKLMPGDIVYFGTYANATTQETISLTPALGTYTETVNQP